MDRSGVLVRKRLLLNRRQLPIAIAQTSLNSEQQDGAAGSATSIWVSGGSRNSAKKNGLTFAISSISITARNWTRSCRSRRSHRGAPMARILIDRYRKLILACRQWISDKRTW